MLIKREDANRKLSWLVRRGRGGKKRVPQ